MPIVVDDNGEYMPIKALIHKKLKGVHARCDGLLEAQRSIQRELKKSKLGIDKIDIDNKVEFHVQKETDILMAEIKHHIDDKQDDLTNEMNDVCIIFVIYIYNTRGFLKTFWHYFGNLASQICMVFIIMTT